MRVVCSLRGLFSYKSPLFFNPSFGLKNSPAKALPRTKCFALCGVRPKTLSLESVSFFQKAQPKTSVSRCRNFFASTACLCAVGELLWYFLRKHSLINMLCPRLPWILQACRSKHRCQTGVPVQMACSGRIHQQPL